MTSADPVGLPGVAVLAIAFFAMLLALVAARRRREPGERGLPRSPRSVIGIVVQAIAFGAVAFGGQRVALDPLGTAALVEALVVAMLASAAIALFVAASRAMGRNWGLVARTRDDHVLVTRGPFARMRHPIYSALFLFLPAIAIALGHTAHLLIAIPLYALGTWLRVGEEERLLRARFGTAHDAYAARVRRFVPGMF